MTIRYGGRSWNLNQLSDDLIGPFKTALASLEADKQVDGTENINTLRRAHGLPPRQEGRYHRRWTDTSEEKSYLHIRRYEDDPAAILAALLYLGWGAVIGGVGVGVWAWLTGWRPF